MAKKPKDPGPSAADVAQGEVQGQRWTHYMESYAPAEVALIKRSEFSAGERNRVEGEAAADAAQAFKGLNRKTISASSQAGQKAGAGALLADLASNAEAQGEVTGSGRNAAKLGGRLQSEMEKFHVVKTGQNIVSGVTSDLSMAGRRQTQVSLQKAFLQAQKQNEKMAAAAAIGGAAAAKFGPMLKDKWDAKKMEKLQADATEAGVGIPEFSSFESSNIGEDLMMDYLKNTPLFKGGS